MRAIVWSMFMVGGWDRGCGGVMEGRDGVEIEDENRGEDGWMVLYTPLSSIAIVPDCHVRLLHSRD
jgi:hypothetical protein